jgi:hypothetical protein
MKIKESKERQKIEEQEQDEFFRKTFKEFKSSKYSKKLN